MALAEKLSQKYRGRNKKVYQFSWAWCTDAAPAPLENILKLLMLVQVPVCIAGVAVHMVLSPLCSTAEASGLARVHPQARAVARAEAGPPDGRPRA